MYEESHDFVCANCGSTKQLSTKPRYSRAWGWFCSNHCRKVVRKARKKDITYTPQYSNKG